MNEQMETNAKILADLAAKSQYSNDALKYSQAALNVAHAIGALENVKREAKYLIHNLQLENS